MAYPIGVVEYSVLPHGSSNCRTVGHLESGCRIVLCVQDGADEDR